MPPPQDKNSVSPLPILNSDPDQRLLRPNEGVTSRSTTTSPITPVPEPAAKSDAPYIIKIISLLSSVNWSHPARIDAEDGDGEDRCEFLSDSVLVMEEYQYGGDNWVYGKTFKEEWGGE